MKNRYIDYFTHMFSAGCLAFCLAACGDDSKGIPEWDWGEAEPEQGQTDEAEEKPRYVWIDAAGNFEDYANNQDKIKADLKKIKETGFTDIIVDVRPTTGDVLFKSKTADPLQRIDVWNSLGYVWAERTATWDYLQTFIDEGHRLGLKVNASINTFVGGYLCPYGLGSEGAFFRNDDMKAWASVVNASSGMKNSMDMLDDSEDYGAKFFNPANEDAQDYVLDILADLAQYDLDGIILDRCRYDDNGLMSDFSEESRRQFELYIGHSVTAFPDDVFAPGTVDLPATLSNLQKQWLEFRAKVIHDFIVEARETVKKVDSSIRFGAYVGAWYSTYYESGVNWASPDYNTAMDYPRWASATYKNYGYADHTDFLFLGAYAGVGSIYGSGEWTMQGFCVQGRKLIGNATTFVGGPDIGNSTGWEDGGQSAKIPDAIDACISNSDGVFIFDLCHIKMHNYWSSVKRGIDAYLTTLKK